MSRLFKSLPRKTLLFYDFETTGLSPVFDQVVRGAFIRTTADFKEIERHELSVQLNPDVIPSPGALVVNRLSMEDLKKGKNEYEAMQEMYALVNEPGTTSVGYNSAKFDDLFLRFGFHRNLLPPYAHHDKNSCGRMDIYPMTVAYYLLRNKHLQWVMKDTVPSFKLESMNQANSLFSGRAHDAMTDTETTLALAKRLHDDKSMWDLCSQFFDKNADKKRIDECTTTLSIGNVDYKIGLMINHRSQGRTIVPVLLLGTSHAYSNKTIWLRLDQDLACDVESVKIIRKKMGEPPFFMSIETPNFQLLPEDTQAQFVKTREWLKKNPTVLIQIREYFLTHQYTNHDCDVSAQLYQLPLLTPAEELLFTQFHAAKLEDKSAIAAQFPRLEHRQLAIRLLGRHYPTALSSQNDSNAFDDHMNNVFSAEGVRSPIDYKGDKQFSFNDVRVELQKLAKKSLDSEQQEIIKGYKSWLDVATKRGNEAATAPVEPTLFKAKAAKKIKKIRHPHVIADEMPTITP